MEDPEQHTNLIHDFYQYEHEHWDSLLERIPTVEDTGDGNGNGNDNDDDDDHEGRKLRHEVNTLLGPAINKMYHLVDQSIKDDEGSGHDGDDIGAVAVGASTRSHNGDHFRSNGRSSPVADTECFSLTDHIPAVTVRKTGTDVTPEHMNQNDDKSKKKKRKESVVSSVHRIDVSTPEEETITRKGNESEGIRRLDRDFDNDIDGHVDHDDDDEGAKSKRKRCDKEQNNNKRNKNPPRPSTKRVTRNSNVDIDANISTQTGSNVQDTTVTTELETASTSTTDIGIHPRDSWKFVWEQMRKIGWDYTNGDLIHTHFYILPGRKKSKRSMKYGIDYLHSEDELKDYAKSHYGWEGDDCSYYSSSGSSNSGSTPQSERSDVTMECHNEDSRDQESEFGDIAPSGSDGDESMVNDASYQGLSESEQEEDSHADSGSDSAEGTSSGDSSISGIHRDEKWSSVWLKLKADGWRWDHNKGREAVTRWYFPPGKNKKKGQHGKDYFSEEALKEWVKQHHGWMGTHNNEPNVKTNKRMSAKSNTNPISSPSVPSNILVTKDKQGQQKKKETTKRDKAKAATSKPKSTKTAKKSKAGSNATTKQSNINRKGKGKAKSSVSASKKRKNGTVPALKKKKRVVDHSRTWGKETCSEEQEQAPPSPINKITWNILEEMEGWSIVERQNRTFYAISGVDAYSIDDHELGVDYFMSKEEAVDHVQFHPELLANVNLRNACTELLEQDSSSTVSMAPSSSPETQSSPEEFKLTWKYLKDEKGWTARKARNPLHDWYYVRPGVDPMAKESELGKDYFQDEFDAVEYARAEELSCKDSASSKDYTPSVNDSASPVIDSNLSLSKSSIGSTPSSSQSTFVPFSIQDCEDSWWVDKEIPTFNWSKIKKLLKSVRYTGSRYVAPDGTKFDTANDLRVHVCAIGLPEDDLKDLGDEDKEYIERYFSLAHLPTKIGTHSLNQFNSIELLSHLLDLGLMRKPFNDEMARDALCNHFDYEEDEDGTLRAPTDQIQNGSDPCFGSLDELRSAIRTYGLNHFSGQDERKDEYCAALILWASVLPFPIYKDKTSNGEINVPGKKKQSSNVQIVRDSCNQSENSNDKSMDRPNEDQLKDAIDNPISEHMQEEVEKACSEQLEEKSREGPHEKQVEDTSDKLSSENIQEELEEEETSREGLNEEQVKDTTDEPTLEHIQEELEDGCHKQVEEAIEAEELDQSYQKPHDQAISNEDEETPEKDIAGGADSVDIQSKRIDDHTTVPEKGRVVEDNVANIDDCDENIELLGTQCQDRMQEAIENQPDKEENWGEDERAAEEELDKYSQERKEEQIVGNKIANSSNTDDLRNVPQEGQKRIEGNKNNVKCDWWNLGQDERKAFEYSISRDPEEHAEGHGAVNDLDSIPLTQPLSDIEGNEFHGYKDVENVGEGNQAAAIKSPSADSVGSNWFTAGLRGDETNFDDLLTQEGGRD